MGAGVTPQQRAHVLMTSGAGKLLCDNSLPAMRAYNFHATKDHAGSILFKNGDLEWASKHATALMTHVKAPLRASSHRTLFCWLL